MIFLMFIICFMVFSLVLRIVFGLLGIALEIMWPIIKAVFVIGLIITILGMVM